MLIISLIADTISVYSVEEYLKQSVLYVGILNLQKDIKTSFLRRMIIHSYSISWMYNFSTIQFYFLKLSLSNRSHSDQPKPSKDLIMMRRGHNSSQSLSLCFDLACRLETLPIKCSERTISHNQKKSYRTIVG